MRFRYKILGGLKLQIHQQFDLSDCVIQNCSQQKYEHHTPWPAFKNPVHEDSLSKVKFKNSVFEESFQKVPLLRSFYLRNMTYTISIYSVVTNHNFILWKLGYFPNWQVLESEGAYKVSCGKCSNPLGHEFLKDGPDGVGSRSLFHACMLSSKTKIFPSLKIL